MKFPDHKGTRSATASNPVPFDEEVKALAYAKGIINCLAALNRGTTAPLYGQFAQVSGASNAIRREMSGGGGVWGEGHGKTQPKDQTKGKREVSGPLPGERGEKRKGKKN